MSRKQFRLHASSSRAVSGALPASESAFGTSASDLPQGFGASATSPLSHVYEPPELSQISDSHIVVALKNLQKKDSTTKSKAIEDLHSYVTSADDTSQGVEDAFLEAWIKLYPRTSIDGSRRVRQLAHTFQGLIAISCGKRIAKHMPGAIGAWLAGLHDNDKLVARASEEAFSSVFTGQDRRRNVWKVYQAHILTYCKNAVFGETVWTLSDERTVSPDDAEAKYARVVGTSLLTLANVLDILSKDELQEQRALYFAILKPETAWKFSSHSDAFVRRAIYKVLAAILAKDLEDYLDLSTISKFVLQKSLEIDQAGSSHDYVTTLVHLTAKIPALWTELYSGSGKKSAHNRLCELLQKGSQGAPSEFWNRVTSLLELVPMSVIQLDHNEQNGTSGLTWTVVQALHDGFSRKSELRTSVNEGWRTYLAVVERLRSSQNSTEAQEQLLSNSIIPIINQYVRPDSEAVKWSLGPSNGEEICATAVEMVWSHMGDAFVRLWCDLSSSIVRDLQISLPEQSKNYRESQDSISTEVRRWYSLKQLILSRGHCEKILPLFNETTMGELESAINLLKARKGKSYSAASVLESAVYFLSGMIRVHERAMDVLLDFSRTDLPLLLLSPSSSHIVRFLNGISALADTQKIYEESVQAVTEAPDSEAKREVLRNLVSSRFFGESGMSSRLFNVVKGSLQRSMGSREDDWTLMIEAFANPAAPDDLKNDLLLTMIEGLSMESQAEAALRGLDIVFRKNRRALQTSRSTFSDSDFLSKLLFLSDSSNETIRSDAKRLYETVQALCSQDDAVRTRTSMIDVLKKGVDTADSASISITSLVAQAKNLLQNTTIDKSSILMVELLPTFNRWQKVMKPFLERAPPKSLAIVSQLGGTIYLVDRTEMTIGSEEDLLKRDRDGYSVALRMAWFVTKLSRSVAVFETLSEEVRSVTILFLAVFNELASDNLSVPGPRGLWLPSSSSIDDELVDFIAQARALVTSWSRSATAGQAFISQAQKALLARAKGSSPEAYYCARAYATISEERHEIHRSRPSSDDEAPFTIANRGQDVISETAFLIGCTNSETIGTICNKLVADLTTLDFQEHSDEGLHLLLLLNCTLVARATFLVGLPQQRIVFYTKHIIKQLQTVSLSPDFVSEVYKTLTAILPSIRDVYGSFWAECIEVLVAGWAGANYIEDIPYKHSSLRLYALLQSLAAQGANADLQESLTQTSSQVFDVLLILLKRQSTIPDETHQPLQIVNELLSRQILQLQPVSTTDADDLYPVLACESGALQSCAYEILHRHIPKTREHLSLDAALSEDYTAKLPENILSLILVAPVRGELLGGEDQTIFMPLRGYLLSWKLVFDHWTNASHKVQSDYASSVRQGTYLKNLLDFAFELLIHSRTRPVDASRFDIDSYALDREQSPEKGLQWLTIHLYYLSLKYLPSLSRAWWRDECPRNLQRPVEAWTERYISHLVIRSELATVTAWLPTQDVDDQELQVKVSHRGHEVTVSYPIDDQSMSIRILLPASYPLSPIVTESVHRVGVDEKKWRSWLVTTQGVINFSSTTGALIDGLVAWRKNVTGALKGQSECAICYSVVSADRQLPNKRCSTCKKLFHGSCLFKWFRSSGSSSCPLCRNAFNYG